MDKKGRKPSKREALKVHQKREEGRNFRLGGEGKSALALHLALSASQTSQIPISGILYELSRGVSTALRPSFTSKSTSPATELRKEEKKVSSPLPDPFRTYPPYTHLLKIFSFSLYAQFTNSNTSRPTFRWSKLKPGKVVSPFHLFLVLFYHAN